MPDKYNFHGIEVPIDLSSILKEKAEILYSVANELVTEKNPEFVKIVEQSKSRDEALDSLMPIALEHPSIKHLLEEEGGEGPQFIVFWIGFIFGLLLAYYFWGYE